MTKLFISYSHLDESYRQELEKHMVIMKYEGLIDSWHDRRILAGDELDPLIMAELEDAKVILCLVSADFLASPYCYTKEMERALERHEKKEARVIPIIVEPCDWLHSPLKKLRSSPNDNRPISKFPNRNDAYLEVVTDIRAVLKEMGVGEQPSTSFTTPSLGPVPPVVIPATRSSNLRVKRPFSDKDKDDFIRDGFVYITNFIENSLSELVQRSPHLTYNAEEITKKELEISVYEEGTIKSYGTLTRKEHVIQFDPSAGRQNRMFMGGEAVQLSDDGFQLGYQFYQGMSGYTRTEKMMSHQGAAEFFWSLLIKPLQE